MFWRVIVSFVEASAIASDETDVESPLADLPATDHGLESMETRPDGADASSSTTVLALVRERSESHRSAHAHSHVHGVEHAQTSV